MVDGDHGCQLSFLGNVLCLLRVLKMPDICASARKACEGAEKGCKEKEGGGEILERKPKSEAWQGSVQGGRLQLLLVGSRRAGFSST